ncbi:transglycosylase domain-containing protein [Altererythrobacter sp. MF3-039]|uniref:transglycosylase domain-containing protein n=1 Tax=Altererythrobacter sp. MF3-039 TaxID=3252901 RepID=UPI00390C724A
MGIFGRKDKRGTDLEGDWQSHTGYFSLHDIHGDGPNYEEWDRRLERADRHAAAIRPKTRWWQPSDWRNRRKRWWFVRIVAALLAIALALFAWLALTAPLSKSLEPIVPPQVTLLAADGTPIARNGAVVAEPVEVAELPPHVVEAFLAIEDRRFYSHLGVDPRGLARAAFTGVGGGSTITQQLAKFTFLTPERTLTRKAREMLIAFWLEGWLTKDEILERYLSNTYFGDNVYGLRAASLHYFYRKPENLTLAQSAMLAGLVQAPSRLNPAKHYDRAERRMRLVVGAMVAAGYLSETEAEQVRSPRLDIRPSGNLPTGTYFADWALPEARKLTGSGYAQTTLTTTLDSRLQRIAGRVVSSAPLGSAQVALIAMRPNGEVVAMVGGKDYAKSPFNRAVQARRQAGSTIKTFVYLAALRDGWNPDDTIGNTEITEGSYRPRNANGRYSETITLRDALARSSNVATLRLFNEVGSEKVIGTARDFGIEAEMAKGDPSIALGSASVSLINLTAAYAGVAGNRFPVEPHAFAQEDEGWFEWLTSSRQSLSTARHEQIEEMLRAVVNQGTGRAAMLSIPNYGKTGTSQNNRDALFVGYAGGLVVGVWIGNDDNSPLDGISGGGLPARIWRSFMVQALGNDVAAPGPQPVGTSDPGGEVEPLDVPDLGEIPIGDGRATLRIENDGVIISGDVEGVPIDITLGEDGLQVRPRDTR